MQGSNDSRKTSITSRRAFLQASTAAAGAVIAANGLARAAGEGQTPSGSATRAAAPSRRQMSEVREALSGPWPTIRTHFTSRGEIDFDSIRGHLDFMIDEALGRDAG